MSRSHRENSQCAMRRYTGTSVLREVQIRAPEPTSPCPPQHGCRLEQKTELVAMWGLGIPPIPPLLLLPLWETAWQFSKTKTESPCGHPAPPLLGTLPRELNTGVLTPSSSRAAHTAQGVREHCNLLARTNPPRHNPARHNPATASTLPLGGRAPSAEQAPELRGADSEGRPRPMFTALQ